MYNLQTRKDIILKRFFKKQARRGQEKREKETEKVEKQKSQNEIIDLNPNVPEIA